MISDVTEESVLHAILVLIDGKRNVQQNLVCNFAFRCDLGYGGDFCEASLRLLPTMLVSNMGTTSDVLVNFPRVKGASLGYACGVISSAKALVFNGDGPRMTETQELNTLGLRYAAFFQPVLFR